MTPSDSLAGLTLSEFSDRLASAEPVPGGGSASAILNLEAGNYLLICFIPSADGVPHVAGIAYPPHLIIPRVRVRVGDAFIDGFIRLCLLFLHYLSN